MNIRQRITAFNKSCAPFYLVDLDNGRFSLCLALSFMGERYADFGQEAFNRYARQIGEPVMERGLYTYGDGYEWETVFRKAFEHSPDLEKIEFDSEAGGFFCDAEDLLLIEDFGRRFRSMVMDTEGFARLVSSALTEAAERQLRNAVTEPPAEVPAPRHDHGGMTL